jgi:hypothetical protein
MVDVELTARELKLVESALHAYLDDFGHDEADLVRELKALIAKLPAPVERGEPPNAAGPVTEL